MFTIVLITIFFKVMVFAYSSKMIKTIEVSKPDCLNPKLGRANSLNKDKIFGFYIIKIE